ncbi:MAG: hypothetical protein H0X42_07080 [Solirubrobacterales bacterium]|nr:hypothetical protein [Solirubrobacterales bacterium]
MIGRQHLADSSVNQAFTASTGQSLTGLAVGGGYIYWTSNNQDTSEVGRTPVIGGQQYQSITSVFGEPNPHTCGVAVDGKYVYWANRATNSIGRAELANFATAGQVVEGDWLPLPDPPLSGIVSSPCGVAVDENFVYWGINSVDNNGTLERGTTIGRAKKSDGSGAGNGFLGGGNTVTGLTIDGEFLYWSNAADGLPGHGSIGRGNVSGTGFQEQFVSGLNVPFGVAVDSGGPPAPPPVINQPGATSYVPPLIVSCGDCGSGGPGPPPKRPDFSRVWTNHAVFVPAQWSTPLVVGTSSHRAGARASSAAAGAPPVGTTFNFILNRAAQVKVAIKHKGGKTVATLVRTGHKGKNELPFSGRIKGKALDVGAYNAVFSARSGKKRSKPQVLAFRVAGG